MILKNNNPIYQEIVDEIKKYIELGIYKTNEKLPTIRNLALELRINPNTVQRAYKVLEEEGYIKTIIKKGIYVAYSQDKVDEKLEKAHQLLELLKNTGFTKQEILSVMEDVYHD